jgi:hypothetical protein
MWLWAVLEREEYVRAKGMLWAALWDLEIG